MKIGIFGSGNVGSAACLKAVLFEGEIKFQSSKRII